MSNKVSSFFRLDEQVFFTMGGVCLLSLIIVIFRYTTDRPCFPVAIQIGDDPMIEDVSIRFKAQIEGGKNYSWNFGDSTQVSDDQTATTSHRFKKAGKYTVSVVVNGQCSDFETVTIREKPVISIAPLMPIIDGVPNNIAYLNVPVKFAEISNNGTSWEWRFGETSIVDARGQIAEYTFKTIGPKSITVTINGKPELVYHKFINVIEKQNEKNSPKANEPRKYLERPLVVLPDPQAPPLNNKPDGPAENQSKKEPVKTAPPITSEQLANMLNLVPDGAVTAGDIGPYTCGNLSIPVTFNGKSMTLTEMCEKLKRAKANKRKIKDLKVVVLHQEPGTNCILSMNITVTIKNWIGKKMDE